MKYFAYFTGFCGRRSGTPPGTCRTGSARWHSLSAVNGQTLRQVVLCWLALVCLAISACGPQGYTLEVNVLGLTDDVVQLSVNATAGSESAMSEVNQSLDQLTLRLVSFNSSSGMLNLTVSGIGADGCQRSTAATQVELPPVDPVTVTLAPARGCKLVISKIGNGQGRISTPDGSLACKFDGAPAPDPQCTTQVPGACAYCLPLGTQVTLNAVPEQASTQQTYFAGWAGACTGPASCQLSIGAGEIDVGAGFLSAQACSAGGFCWEHPLPQGNTLRATWGSTADDVWMVGDFGTILHWNGFFFVPYSSGTANNLTSVWGSGPNDVWAVGGFASGLILHYEGTAWSPVDIGINTAPVNAVWGSGPNDVWAVVDAAHILHYDGTTWSLDESTGGDSADTLVGVWGSGPNDIWAVGKNITLHYDGSVWSAPAYPSQGTSYSSVWGSGPDDVWISGGNSPGSHFDGMTWSSAGLLGSTVSAFWGSGPNDIWGVGSVSKAVVHYDGTSWSTYRHEPTDGELNAVWGSGANDIWAIGESMLHWDGVFWIPQDEVLTRRTLYGVWGSGLNNIWAVGDNGTILYNNGAAWNLADSPTTMPLWGVFGTGPGNVWAWGMGVLLHYDGYEWYLAQNPPTGLVAIFGSDPNNLGAITNNGTILSCNDQACSPVTGATTYNFRTAWGSGPSDVWAVDDLGHLYHYDVSGWTQVATPVSGLVDVWGSGPSDVWAVGAGIQHYDGVMWTQLTSPVITDNVAVIWGSGPSDVWIIDIFSNIFRWDGTSFAAIQSGAGANFYFDFNLLAGWSSGPGDAFVVGSDATILHHRP